MLTMPIKKEPSRFPSPPRKLFWLEHLPDLAHLNSGEQRAKAAIKDRPSIPDKDILDIGLGKAVRAAERHQSNNNRPENIQNAAVEDIEETENHDDNWIEKIGNKD